MSERVSVTRRIKAPAGTLFLIVSDPAGHVAIDGSGMLTAARDARRLTTVGETFDIDMDREPLGDFPEMGKYVVRNTVTQLVPDQLFEWAIGGIDSPPFGHVYGWKLEAHGPNETDVTNYCDWSGVPLESRAGLLWPIVPVSMLEQSLTNLEQIATGR